MAVNNIPQSACHLLLYHELARGCVCQQDSCHTKGESGCLFPYAYEYKPSCIVLTIENGNSFICFCFPVFFLLLLYYLFLFSRHLPDFNISPATYIQELRIYKKMSEHLEVSDGSGRTWTVILKYFWKEVFRKLWRNVSRWHRRNLWARRGSRIEAEDISPR